MSLTILQGDCLESLRTLPAESVNCCVTSPPYFGLRDYGVDGQIGLEAEPEAFIAKLVEVFCEVRRVLKGDGTLWVNIGSSYAGNRGNTAENPGYDNKAANKNNQLAVGRSNLVVGDNEPYALRDDLTPDQLAYVLSELGAHFRQSSEVAEPNFPIGINETVTSLAGGE